MWPGSSEARRRRLCRRKPPFVAESGRFGAKRFCPLESDRSHAGERSGFPDTKPFDQDGRRRRGRGVPRFRAHAGAVAQQPRRREIRPRGGFHRPYNPAVRAGDDVGADGAADFAAAHARAAGRRAGGGRRGVRFRDEFRGDGHLLPRPHAGLRAFFRRAVQGIPAGRPR